MHPLEEAMLGCDVDGEGSGYWADGQEGPPLLPTRARVGQVVSVSNPFSPLVCLWSPLTYLSLVCLGAPAGLTPGHPWPCGSLPAPSGGQVGDFFPASPGGLFLTPHWLPCLADSSPAPQAPATSLSPGTAATSRGP